MFKHMEVSDVSLQDLLVDPNAFDQATLAQALTERIWVGRDGSLRPGDAWERLSAKGRVLASLMAVFAAAALGVRPTPYISPMELSELVGLAGGTIRPKLRVLLQERVIEQERDSRRYRVRPAAVAAAARTLAQEERSDR